MSNSIYVSYTKLSPNCDKPRNHIVDKITIHHTGCVNASLVGLGNGFISRKASANYGIDVNGNVGLYVEEADRAWTSGNPDNDNRAITIEIANDGNASTNWHVSDASIESCIKLCVDICQRNRIEKINYTGNKDGNLTMHSMFQATACPGPYLKSKFSYIADEINKRLETARKAKNKMYHIVFKSFEDALEAEKFKTSLEYIGASDVEIKEVEYEQ